MAWSDPSPRARGRSASAQPGYCAPEVRLSFLTIVARCAAALFVAAIAFEVLRIVVLAWATGHGATASPAWSVALPLLVAMAIGWLLLRRLLKRPASVGLSDRVRNGGGWRGSSWSDSDGDPTFAVQVTTDLVEDLVSAAIDAATD
jgi:hypothetical protein